MRPSKNATVRKPEAEHECWNNWLKRAKQIFNTHPKQVLCVSTSQTIIDQEQYFLLYFLMKGITF